MTVLVIISALLVLIKPLDSTSSDYIDSAFKRSLVSFAIARGLNGVISVAQGTEFAIQPAGVGINFSPGEILDPVNDLVERFSWVMLLSSSSLGAQQVLLSVSNWIGFSVLLVLISCVLLLSLWRKKQLFEIQHKIISRIFVFILILRFSVPLMALCNEWAYQQFLDEQYNTSSQQLEAARDEIGKINQDPSVDKKGIDQNDSFMEKAQQLYNSALSQFDFEKKLDRYQAAAEQVSENTIRLIVVYILQTVAFPLFFLWIIIRLIKGVFS